MRVTWSRFTIADGTSHPQIEVSESSDWDLFKEVAAALEVGLGGRWTTQADGLDQAYWDLEAGAGRITLHLEHHLGIRVYPTDASSADSASLALLEEAFRVLESHCPA